ncbi:MAG: esterase family protein [Bacteroidales bacterium]|nr:esterase family protein [Bacteroidales bacterium]
MNVFNASAQPGDAGDRQPVTPVQRSEAGRSVEHIFTSKILGMERAYSVYLPQSYDRNPDRYYPVLYLLHGAGDNNLCWQNKANLSGVQNMLAASGESAEMIIVTPNACTTTEEGGWQGYFDTPQWMYESFFFDEFLPFIEKEYRIITDRDHRALAGLSMGGGGSAKYAQTHPDMFCAAYCMSALMAIPETGGIGGRTDDDPDSPMNVLNNSVNENSCIRFVENANEATKEKLKTISWFIDCGDDDFLLDRNLEFVTAMKQAGIPHQFRVRDGGHTWEYWHSGLYILLPFVSRNFCK